MRRLDKRFVERILGGRWRLSRLVEAAGCEAAGRLVFTVDEAPRLAGGGRKGYIRADFRWARIPWERIDRGEGQCAC